MASMITILSTELHHPSPPIPAADKSSRIIHLNSWDLTYLNLYYFLTGLLLPKNPHHSTDHIFSHLKKSFSQALHHFYPLAGRLATVTHCGGGPVVDSLSVHIDCNDEGAEFILASARGIAVSDIFPPGAFRVPEELVASLFPLRGCIGHDGHRVPLLAVQVTELADGIFVGLTANHIAMDGTSFWHFVNAWSKMSRDRFAGQAGELAAMGNPPVLDRWFPGSCPPPIRLPFTDHRQFIRRPLTDGPSNGQRHYVFRVSMDAVRSLKAKANAEAAKLGHHDDEPRSIISSLQAVAGLAWRAITRARKLQPEQVTTHVMAVGFRSKQQVISPPLPEHYFGNAMWPVKTPATAGEVVGKGLGWTASQLNKTIREMDEATVHRADEVWRAEAKKHKLEITNDGVTVSTLGSPRFNVYGNDFGWGRPTGLRCGGWWRREGGVRVYPGPEEGSMELNVCLVGDTMSALIQDAEFMEFVNVASPSPSHPE